MILALKLPLINPHMSTALIENLHMSVGAPLKVGDKLIDLSIDLSSAFSQDCPPISYYRMVSREKAILKQWLVSPGERIAPDATIALLSTEADEPDGEIVRAVRVTTAGIIFHAQMWSGNQA